ncbi:MAG: hypothetical protein IPJ19_12665 [Planctomycetes bacterium]|nr:hypothetical protein [Planctomycetota bacterium]
MVSQADLLLRILLPALVCVLFCALASRTAEGVARRLVQALACALPYLLIAGCVPLLMPQRSATDLVPLFVLLCVVLATALKPRGLLWRTTPVVLAAGFLVSLFSRLGAPPAWSVRALSMLAFAAAWAAARSGDRERPAWRLPLVLGTAAGAIAFACICGRVASLALIAAGIGACCGASFLVSLRWPKLSFGAPGSDVALLALGGTLACAVFLGELSPYAALALLAALAVSSLSSFPRAFGAQLALTALAVWLAWPADGFVT